MIAKGTDLAPTAMQVATKAASGAVDTSAEITAAAVDIAQTAAGTLATVATNAVLNMLPGAGTTDDDEDARRRNGGKRRSERDER